MHRRVTSTAWASALTLIHCTLQLVHEDVQARARAGSQGRSGAGSGPAACRMSTDDRDPLFTVALPEGCWPPHPLYNKAPARDVYGCTSLQ